MNGSLGRRHIWGVIPKFLLSDFHERRIVAGYPVRVLEDHGKDAHKAGEHEKRKKDDQEHDSSFREVYPLKRVRQGARYIRSSNHMKLTEFAQTPAIAPILTSQTSPNH